VPPQLDLGSTGIVGLLELQDARRPLCR
jgi:hypothetical protein